jgi:hypothetical protein
MKTRRWLLACGLAAIWAGVVSYGVGQKANGIGWPEAHAGCSRSCRPGNLECSSKNVVREIDDGESGARWMLFRDESHPGGPGRLVLQGSSGSANGTAGCGSESGLKTLLRRGTPDRELAIRAGDRLTIRDRALLLDLQLEGTALAPAAAGDPLDVRLKIGGGTVRAIVVKSGLAILSSHVVLRP